MRKYSLLLLLLVTFLFFSACTPGPTDGPRASNQVSDQEKSEQSEEETVELSSVGFSIDSFTYITHPLYVGDQEILRVRISRALTSPTHVILVVSSQMYGEMARMDVIMAPNQTTRQIDVPIYFPKPCYMFTTRVTLFTPDGTKIISRIDPNPNRVAAYQKWYYIKELYPASRYFTNVRDYISFTLERAWYQHTSPESVWVTITSSVEGVIARQLVTFQPGQGGTRLHIPVIFRKACDSCQITISVDRFSETFTTRVVRW